MNLFDFMADAYDKTEARKDKRLAINRAQDRRDTDELYNANAGALQDASLDFVPFAGGIRKAQVGADKTINNFMANQVNKIHSKDFRPEAIIARVTKNKKRPEVIDMSGLEGIFNKRGSYNASDNLIETSSPFNLKHEMVHWKDLRRGNVSGASPSAYKNVLKDESESFNMYLGNSGERRARDASDNMLIHRIKKAGDDVDTELLNSDMEEAFMSRYLDKITSKDELLKLLGDGRGMDSLSLEQLRNIAKRGKSGRYNDLSPSGLANKRTVLKMFGRDKKGASSLVSERSIPKDLAKGTSLMMYDDLMMNLVEREKRDAGVED